MPNRILRESVWTSESLNAVSLAAEGFFLKILPYADDFGRFDARLPVIKGRVVPLRNVRLTEIEEWLAELAGAGMVRFYEVRGVRYGFIPSWDRWNEKRAKASRYPAPEEGVMCEQPQVDASAREHTQADENKCGSIRDLIREARSEKREARSERPAAPPPPPARAGSPADLVRAWNDHRGPLPEAKGLSQSRLRHAKARLADVSDLERWAEAIRRVAASPFCRGESERGWRATFDWLLQPDTLNRIEEGKYDPPAPVPSTRPPIPDWKARQEAEDERRAAEDIAEAVRLRKEAGLAC